MKKHLMWAISLMMVAACSQPPEQANVEPAVPAPWQENIHYAVLEHAPSENPQILEFFSFWCPHCHSFEPIVKALKQNLDSTTSFSKVHVDFMGFTTQDIQQSATAAMLIGRYLDMEDEVNTAIFQHIHVDRKVINSMADTKQVVATLGITEAQFDETLALPELQALIDSHYASFTQYRSDVTGVPTFIVNGKYKAMFTREMNEGDMINLIIWLSRKTDS